MKAIVCKELGWPPRLVLEELPAPPPGPGQAVVAVRACGVNFPDTLVVEGRYQVRPDPPFSPGGEVAGVVRAVGAGVTSVGVGDRVAAVLPFGGFAEELLVAAERLLPLPEGLDFAVAASSLTTYGTAWHALCDRAHLAAGETLLVLGAAGGVGLAALEIGKLLGARVVAAASSDHKLELCRAYGADATILYASEPLGEELKQRTKALTQGRGADVVFDPVGGAYTEAALRATGWNGRLLVVGFAAGDIPRIPTNLLLLKGAAMLGVFWGAFLEREPGRGRGELGEILARVRDGVLRPHLHARVPLARAAEALAELRARRVEGKLVLIP